MTLIIETGPAKVAALRPYHQNPRRGDLTVIKRSLEHHGQYRRIVVNRGTKTGRKNEVLAGNHTMLAARDLGWPEILVDWVDVDEEQASRIVLVDNRSADLGSYDEAQLVELLEALDDLDGTGYTPDDLLELLGNTYEEPEYEVDPEDAPDLPAEPRAQLGEVWLLGPHRLVCGDSRDPQVLARLMGEELADGMWTDPPYGVEYVGGTKDALTIQNDSAEGLADLLFESFKAARGVLRPGAPCYIAHADTERVTFENALRATGYLVRQNLVWVKNALVLGRSDYHYRHEPILEAQTPEAEPEQVEVLVHEPILYGFTPGGKGRLGRGGPRWHGDNRQTTVFQVDKPARSDEHPTMKPVELVRGMLRNSFARDAVVIDLYGGSGTTLVAADMLGLRARLVELDPRYVDVIITRYQRLTGVAAVLEEGTAE